MPDHDADGGVVPVSDGSSPSAYLQTQLGAGFKEAQAALATVAKEARLRLWGAYALKAITVPRSPSCRGLRSPSLFVPT